MLDLIAGLTIGLHMASVHVPALDTQNNTNPGLYAMTESGWVVGAYRNTLSRTSVYGGHVFTHGPFSLTVGVVSGYQERTEVVDCAAIGRPDMQQCWHRVGFSRGALTLLASPSVRLPQVFGVTPRISYIPKVGGPARSHAFHLSLEHKF